MPDDPQPLRAADRDAIQDVLAVGGSPQSQALRRYEATLRMLDVEYADIIRTQRAQITAAEQERDLLRRVVDIAGITLYDQTGSPAETIAQLRVRVEKLAALEAAARAVLVRLDAECWSMVHGHGRGEVETLRAALTPAAGAP